MLAYNKITLQHIAIHEAAEEAADLNLITPDKEVEIKNHYAVDLYSPNIFVRIGLGLLTIFIILASVGLMLLVTGVASPVFILLPFAGSSFAALSYMATTKKHYNSGVDLVLMVATIIFLSGGLSEMISPKINIEVLILLIVCLLSAWLFIRFANTIMALLSFAAAVVSIVNLGVHVGTVSVIIVPFVVMAFAMVVYVVCNIMKKKTIEMYYSKGLFILQLLALLTFYIAGNRAVVDKFAQQILHTSLPTYFTYFLWSFTLIVPLLYVVAGIKFKNLMLCRIGLLCIGLSVLTYRYYYSILSPEASMLLAGVLICIAAYLFTRFLKQPKAGFVFKNLNRRKQDTANLEGVIIAETFGHRQTSPQPETTFGGGSFGGAGAGDQY